MEKRKVNDGMSFEEIQTLYWDKDAIRVPDYKLWRAAVGGRFYFNPDDPEARLYPSVTSIIRAAFPKTTGLQQWELNEAVKHGNINAGKDYARERAYFGTMLHILAADFFGGLEVNLDELEERFTFFMVEREGVDHKAAAALAEKNVVELKKAFLGFLQWVLDYDVKPLFVEALLKSDTYGWASAVDLGCELNMDISGYWGEVYKSGAKKGLGKQIKQAKRTRCIVDFKSGSGLYEEHDLQGSGYRELVHENFPDFATEPYKDEEGNEVMEALPFFIWRPKAWTTMPGYHFTHRPIHPDWAAWVRDAGIARCSKDAKTETVQSIAGTVKREGFDQEHLNELIQEGTVEAWMAADRKKRNEK